MYRSTTAIAALIALAATTAPASALRPIDAAAPYVKACSIVAAAHVGVAPENVLPGYSYPAPRGLQIYMLVGGIRMGCHITSGFRVLGVWYA